jgi:hypothetical protein
MAVPTGFWGGGGGSETQHFPEHFLIQRTYASFLINFAIPACPARWAPFFYIFGGCYTPRWHSHASNQWI